MRMRLLAAMGIVLCASVGVRADDGAEARAIVAKAMQAMGGEANLSKYKAALSKMKGDLHQMGMKIPFTGELSTQGADQQKISLDLDIAGQKVTVVQVLNKDQGWLKINDATMDMGKEKLAETQEEAFGAWIATLVPLKDKAFSLTVIGESMVDDTPVVGIKVSHKGRRDVSLFFDKKTNLLVKTESRVKDEATGQEVNEESFMSGYDGKEVKQPLKITVKRDGKLFIEAEISDVKLEEKIDDAIFAKP